MYVGTNGTHNEATNLEKSCMRIELRVHSRAFPRAPAPQYYELRPTGCLSQMIGVIGEYGNAGKIAE